MRLGLKTFLATLLLAALVVPAATAKPGNGNGGGKPSWAGSSSSHGGGGGHGKPEWAGQGRGHGKAEKTHGPKTRTVATDETTVAPDEEADAPKHDNPAWICKFERDMAGDDAFVDKYATNDNGANAFGMCVSEEAQTRDGVSEDVRPEEEAAAECDVSAGEGDETAGDETVVEDETASEEDAAGDEPVDDETGAQEENASGECAAAGDGEAADDEQGDAVEEQGQDEDADEPEDTGAAALARLFF
jgi:hypothetical protein